MEKDPRFAEVVSHNKVIPIYIIIICILIRFFLNLFLNLIFFVTLKINSFAFFRKQFYMLVVWKKL